MDKRGRELIKLARENFPNAENDCAAVDCYAQKIYSTLRIFFGTVNYNSAVKFYGELKALREELINLKYLVN